MVIKKNYHRLLELCCLNGVVIEYSESKLILFGVFYYRKRNNWIYHVFLLLQLEIPNNFDESNDSQSKQFLQTYVDHSIQFYQWLGWVCTEDKSDGVDTPKFAQLYFYDTQHELPKTEVI